MGAAPVNQDDDRSARMKINDRVFKDVFIIKKRNAN